MSPQTRNTLLSIQAVAWCVLLTLAAGARAETPKPADAVADAVGINTHFGFQGSPFYTQSDLVVGLMQQMGVRHYRDGLTYLGDYPYPADSYAIYNKLGRLGIRGDYVANCSTGLATNQQLLGSLNNVEAVEYPNEYDVAGDANWVQTLRTCGAQEGAVLQQFSSLQFVGPSFVQMTSPAKLGPVPMTANNLHAYFFNYPPDLNYPIGSAQGPNAGGGPCEKNSAGQFNCFPGLRFAIDNVQADGPGKPVWITESGYVTSGQPSGAGQSGYVPAQYEPAYYVREVLWALNNNVPRVYFYSLIDDDASTGSFGLFDGSLQPKPAYYALTNLIRLMTDYGPWTSAPANLDFSLSGGDSYLMHSLLQKSDGTYYLALWLSKSDWDGAKDITPAPESIHIAVSGHTIVSTKTMQTSGLFLPSTVNAGSMTLAVGTSPVFLQIR